MTLSDAYANDGLNRVTAVDSTSVTYDGRFNITGDGTSTWSYDPSNRLTGSGSAALTYDPLGRLYSTTGPAERFQYAGAQIIGAYNSSGGLIERYVPGAGLDDYAAYTAGTTTLTREWPVTDPLGSVIAITNASAVASINRYDEYGVPASGNGGLFGYAGALRLTQTGDAPWHMRNRQYHAELGRFLQTDPIGYAGGVNLYAYVGGDPVNAVDPFGLDEYWYQWWWCPSGPANAEDEVEPVPVPCYKRFSRVRLDAYPFFGGYGADYLVLAQLPSGARNPSLLGRVCPTGPYMRLGTGIGGGLSAGPSSGDISTVAGISFALQDPFTSAQLYTSDTIRGGGSLPASGVGGNVGIEAEIGFQRGLTQTGIDAGVFLGGAYGPGAGAVQIPLSGGSADYSFSPRFGAGVGGYVEGGAYMSRTRATRPAGCLR